MIFVYDLGNGQTSVQASMYLQCNDLVAFELEDEVEHRGAVRKLATYFGANRHHAVFLSRFEGIGDMVILVLRGDPPRPVDAEPRARLHGRGHQPDSICPTRR